MPGPTEGQSSAQKSPEQVLADGRSVHPGHPSDGQPTSLLQGAGSPLFSEEEAYQSLLRAAQQLISRIHHREEEIRRLLRVTENINRGLGLEEVLEFLYQELRTIIPFNRIGCALIDEKGEQVVAHWARSDRPVYLTKGFQSPLAGSTLLDVVRTSQPRILNDLEGYLHDKPQSLSTELIVREGMRSSLTCPLVVQGRPIGFLFFSSDRLATYSRVHVEFFQQIAGQLSLIVEKGRLYSELAEQAALIERQNRQLLEQLELARQFQRTMVPSDSMQLPGLALAFVYLPALQIGGDILDIVPLPGERVLVFVGDAMGHGVEAAMIMAATKTALLAAARSAANPADLLGQINEELYEMLQGCRFVTAACAYLDPTAGCASLALAGHANPFHIRAVTGEVTRPGDADIPLGVRAGRNFSVVSCSFKSGDTLIFFSDGIVEAKNATGQFYGDERFAELVQSHGRSGPTELLRTIEADVRGFCQQLSPGDDLTMLVVQSC